MNMRVNSPVAPPINDASSDNASGAAQTQEAHKHHGPARAQTHKPATRPRAKKRRGADAQDGIDESGASEELVMMLAEHQQRNAETVMRVGERRHGEHGNSGGGQQDDGEHESALGVAQARRRLRLARGAQSPEDIEAARLEAEAALLETRRAQAAERTGERANTSSTYAVLTIMRDFLAMPSAAAKENGTLAAVRQRLIETVEAPVSRAPAQQESINTLMPVMRLMLEKKRTDAERKLAVAKINALLGHRRARL
jgi:type III secretion regulatory protein HpaA